MSALPGLSPAELERLALLSEELGEAQQAVGKILRHGYESTSPFDPLQRTNRQSLERELGDVRHAMVRLCDAGDLSKVTIHQRAEEKAVAVRPYLHHQVEPDICPNCDSPMPVGCDGLFKDEPPPCRLHVPAAEPAVTIKVSTADGTEIASWQRDAQGGLIQP